MKVQRITIGGKKGVTHPKFGKLEDIAGEVNVAESFAEAVTLSGGEAKARDCLNYLTISGAKRNATAMWNNCMACGTKPCGNKCISIR